MSEAKRTDPITPTNLTALATGELFRFADWPNARVPRFAAGVYTVWNSDGAFVYVGMSGRSITEATAVPKRAYGLFTRLNSHASGRRSGDQFCVYVADRVVLPSLTTDDIEGIASGRHQLDAFVRRYIHQNLNYRFMVMPDGAAAYAAEAAIRTGGWGHGRPMLNPARP